MIFAFLLAGAILIASSLQNTEHELGQQLMSDLLGQDGFIAWAGAILAIGCIGYIPGLQPASRYLLTLLVVVMVTQNSGLFANIQAALQGASSAGPAPSVPSEIPASSSSTTINNAGSSSNPVSSASSALNAFSGLSSLLGGL